MSNEHDANTAIDVALRQERHEVNVGFLRSGGRGCALTGEIDAL